MIKQLEIVRVQNFKLFPSFYEREKGSHINFKGQNMVYHDKTPTQGKVVSSHNRPSKLAEEAGLQSREYEK